MAIYHYGEPSPFPPSFDGSQWAYGFGLFGDVVAAALGLTMLLSYVFEFRRHKQISAEVKNLVQLTPLPRWTPLTIYRTFHVSMLTFVVMRALPDALWMLAWGEVSEPTIRFMLAMDLWGDGLALIPLSLAIFCWAWGRQILPQKLLVGSWSAVHHPDWSLIWKNARIVLVVFVIAIGVTVGKASA